MTYKAPILCQENRMEHIVLLEDLVLDWYWQQHHSVQQVVLRKPHCQHF